MTSAGRRPRGFYWNMGCDLRFSSQFRALYSAALHLGRWILGGAAIFVLAACQHSSSSQNNLSSSVTGAATPAVALTTSRSSVAIGTPATLQWSAQHAQTCEASGGWSGSQPTTGAITTDPLMSTTNYILTCTGPGGSASQSAEVIVTSPSPTVTMSASPTTIASGGTSTLNWNADRATACTASGGWHGSVATTGTCG
jgi:hypothetical protein